MCTAVAYKTRDHYFGRNLDLHISYGETVAVTPRNFPLRFREVRELSNHYAMIGIAVVENGYPLYYEATNERGLSMAGLNFPGNAEYKSYADGMDNVAPFEFIPWVLGQCSNVDEAVELISQMNILNVNFSGEYPLAPLHWMISDRNNSITVEPVSEGLKIYDNPYGALTNNPKFDYHMSNLINYMGVTREPAVNRYSDKLKLEPYSLGMGSIGLPGDMSSSSRFVRAVFTKMNSVCGDSETESVAQFFHILGAVEQTKGCTSVGGSEYEYTIYSCCCNTDKGVYYYTTYNNRGITAVDMHKEDLNLNRVIMFPLETEPQIFRQN